MVIPMAAAAASRLGPAVRSAGGKFMHSNKAGIRKMGSKMMKTSDDKVELGINKLVKKSEASIELFKNVSKNVGKILGAIAKHSPALKQQLIVMNKGLSVMIRPIGDIMAKFLRPMAIWVMKVAQKWYQLFGTGANEKASDSYIEDELKQLKTEKESALMRGDVEGATSIQAQIDAKQSGLDSKTGDSPFAKLWDNLIPDAFKETLNSIGGAFSSLWKIVKSVGDLLWTIFGPGLERLGVIIGGVLLGALKAITFLFEGITVVFDILAAGIDVVSDTLKVLKVWFEIIVDWVGTKLVAGFKKFKEILVVVDEWVDKKLRKAFENLKEDLSTLYNWLSNTFNNIWDTLLKSMQSMWTGVKRIIDKIQFWKSSPTEEKAVGGMIDTTDMYKLHAGERVITAGDASRSDSSTKSMVFNITQNVAATINSDLDIAELARELAQLQETELRRRVSYF